MGKAAKKRGPKDLWLIKQRQLVDVPPHALHFRVRWGVVLSVGRVTVGVVVNRLGAYVRACMRAYVWVRARACVSASMSACVMRACPRSQPLGACTCARAKPSAATQCGHPAAACAPRCRAFCVLPCCCTPPKMMPSRHLIR